MDIRIDCQGSEIDSSKPYAALLNYDGEPYLEQVKADLVAYICDYRDDLRNPGEHKVHLVMDAGVATVEIANEQFQLRLDINPDIPRGASVRISDPEAEAHGSYGVLEDADPVYDSWTVRMLDGGWVQFARDELADLARKTTVDGPGTPIEVPAAFDIGELVLYEPGRDGNKINEGKVVQITGRRYTPGHHGAEWSYWAADVETGIGNLSVGELSLSKLPRNLQNLQIIPRQG